MILEVYDYDTITSSDFIGSCRLELDELFRSGNWFNDWKVLINEKGFPTKGDIYFQVQWREEGKKWDAAAPANKYDELLKKKQEELALQLKKQEEEKNEKAISGKLGVNIIKGKDIKDVETIGGVSDPYVEVTVNRGSSETIITQTIDNNLNPVWNCTNKEIAIKLPEKFIDSEYLCLRLMDKNYTSDTFIGSASILISECFKQPGKWAINQYFNCNDKEGKEITGKVYV